MTTLFDAFKTNSAWVGNGLVQPDGKIVAVGDTDYQGRGELVVGRFAPTGGVDPSFGGDGIVTTDLGGGVTAKAVALGPDGRIVVVAKVTCGPTDAVALVRYNPDGSLDPSFGSGGVAITACGVSIAAAAVQSDGRVVIAGSTPGSTGRDFAVARYTADGVLDPSFGGDGVVTAPFGGDAAANAVAVDGDGKIVALGVALTGSPPRTGFAVARYNPDGTLDSSFGSGGTVTTAIGTDAVDEETTSVVIQPDGKILAAGHAFYGASTALVRYDADGSLDASFGSGGIVTADVGPSTDPVVAHQSLALQPDGRIAVAVTQAAGFGAARFDQHGVLDPSFGTGGVAMASFDADGATASALALDTGGRLLVIGDAYRLGQNTTGPPFPVYGEFAVARFNGDGSLDPSFGLGGTAITSAGDERVDGTSRATSIIHEHNGKVVLVGESFAAAGVVDAAVARYEPGGSLDPSFGDGGTAVTQRAGDASSFVGGPAAALGANAGKVIVVGTASRLIGLSGSAGRAFALMRYRADGSLDPSFGSDGKVVTRSFSATAITAVRQPNAKVIVLGATHRGTLVARYRPDGSLDRSFGRRGTVTITRRLFAFPRGVVLEPRGRIVVGSAAGLVGLKRSGVIDRSFGHRGFAAVLGPNGVGLNEPLWAGRGRLLLTGDIGGHLTLFRYRANGFRDRSFGERGKVVDRGVGFPGQSGALQPNGKLIVMGEESRQLVLTRLNQDGSRDRSFGRHGRVVVPLAGTHAALQPIPGHRLLVAGSGRGEVPGHPPRTGFLLARLHR